MRPFTLGVIAGRGDLSCYRQLLQYAASARMEEHRKDAIARLHESIRVCITDRPRSPEGLIPVHLIIIEEYMEEKTKRPWNQAKNETPRCTPSLVAKHPIRRSPTPSNS